MRHLLDRFQDERRTLIGSESGQAFDESIFEPNDRVTIILKML